MNKNHIMALALVLPALAAYADYPSGYYNSLDGKTGVDLMRSAKNIVARHTVISYGDHTWDAFETTDVKMVNGKEAWWDMYSNEIVYVSSGHAGLNIEHSVANSWWGKTKNDAYKDLFHLNPSDATANNRKANYPLGEISGNPTWTNGVTSVGHPVSGQGGGNTMVYEPPTEYKGDFARAFMYIFTVYNDISWKENYDWMYTVGSELMFKDWAKTLLLKWSDNDPVDEKEASRNEAIYKIQKNRNPYIDLPDLCHYIWGEKSGTPYSVNNGGSVNPPTPPTPGSDVILDMNFDNVSSISGVEAEGWWNDAVSGSLKGWYTTSFDGNQYAAASAYKGTETGGPYEFWLITPALQAAEDDDMILTFRTQGAYGVEDSYLEAYAMSTSDPRTATLTKLDANICTPNSVGVKPVYSDWMLSGNVEIPHDSKAVYVGFKYYSEKGGNNNSATYCLDDVKVTVKKSGDVEEAVEDMYIVCGGEGYINVLSPSELTNLAVFDLSGRCVASFDKAGGQTMISLPAGLYIVTSNSRPPRKVIVK
ncbi:MAG: endonuclease [Prevotella sp.]|nr:endonuclease [Bacteroides sp.]MCM1366381.1 endonuclease [Prevotella sp.]MCM1436690.1 endonuclease [Prevotella sp.]